MAPSQVTTPYGAVTQTYAIDTTPTPPPKITRLAQGEPSTPGTAASFSGENFCFNDCTMGGDVS